jgi:asparagine synthase (glutamine-hydrolysing)
MCGVTGWIDWRRDIRGKLACFDLMIDALGHRGPDAKGFWASPHALLGHTRLAIVDPDNGRQPMTIENGAVSATVVYGGEIYNYRELTAALKRDGIIFHTNSDTEVILHCYAKWGEHFVHHLNGMFAIAIWDSTKRHLILARDHVGIKPLFFYATDNEILFASEPKAILASSLVSPAVDEVGLAEILGLWPYKTPGQGVYRGIREVRPGEIIRFAESGAVHTRYWTPPTREHPDDVEATLATVRDLIRDSVDSHLVSDVPLCALLSGGVDSTTVTALAAARSNDRLATFAVDFASAESSFRPSAFRPERDAPYVQIASEAFATDHLNILLGRQEILDHHEYSLIARDLPDTGDMDASLLLLFRQISTRFKVALSGEGADEIFGGYPWFNEDDDEPITDFPWSQYLCFDQSILTDQIRSKIRLHEYVHDRFTEAVAELPTERNETAQSRRMRILSHLDLSRFLPGQLERKDRMSMASGVEARVPFCDRGLVEYVVNIPWSMKRVDNIEKGILRRAVTPWLPREITLRRKASYPTTLDPLYVAELSAEVRRIMDLREAPIRDIVDRRKVLAILDGSGPPPPSRPTVWMGRLISLHRWLARYDVAVEL